MARTIFLGAVFLFLFGAGGAAQPAVDTLDRLTWRELIEPLDYGDGRSLRETRERKTPTTSRDNEREPDRERPAWSLPDWMSAPWMVALSRLVLVLGAAAVLFVLIRSLLDQPRRRPPKKRAAPDDLDLDTLVSRVERQPEAHDLEALIARAENAANFPVALRLRYRRALLLLIREGALRRGRGKPNRAYLGELAGTPMEAPMRTLTDAFERAVYGGFPLSAEAYGRFCQAEKSLSAALQQFQSPTAPQV